MSISEAFDKWKQAKIRTAEARRAVRDAPTYDTGDTWEAYTEARRAEVAALERAQAAYKAAGRNWTHGV